MLPEEDLVKIARTKGEFLDAPVVLEELTRSRQALPRLIALEKAVQAMTGAVRTPAHEQWVIGAPIPKSERRRVRSTQEWTQSLSQIARDVDALRFRFEMLQKRWELVSQGGFSPRFRKKVRASLDDFAVGSLDKIRRLNSMITRISGISLRKGFVDPGSIEARPPRSFMVPDNRNLRLRVKGAVARVTADFETDIANDAVLKTIKASIEDYWRGNFVVAGKTMRFRTTVNIRKLPPGRGFSPGSLTLREAADTIAHANAGGIVFDRDLRYDVAPHEFGHVLGLSDEYTEGYRAAEWAAVNRQKRGSLMGSLGADILPRHLKTTYQLLRRRSLVN